MKVTIVTAYFSPEVTPITHLYADLAADLAGYGAEVTVVTGQPNRGLDPETWKAYLDRKKELTPQGYQVIRVGGSRREGEGLLRRGWCLFRQTFDLYRAAKDVETDVYLLGSMPPMLGLVGARLHHKARTTFILQDIFPDTILLMGKFSPGHPLIRLARLMEKRTYEKNDRFITLSGDMKQTLLSRGVEDGRITVIPNWADADHIRPVLRHDNPLFDQLGLSRDGFYVLYAGTLGILQNPDLLLDAAKRLSHKPEIRFLILGGGALAPHVQQRVREEGLSNVQLFPMQPVERVAQVYSLGNIVVTPLKKGVTACAMPSKTWSAMAAGAPVIATADPGSEWERVIRTAGGICVPPEDSAALADAVEKAYADRETLPQMGVSSRAYVAKALSRGAATRAYYQVLQQGEKKHV